MITVPTRQQIARIVGNDQAMMRALEEVFRASNINTSALASQALDGIAAANAAEVAGSVAGSASEAAMFAALSPAAAPGSQGLSVDPAIAVPIDITMADVAPATGALIGD